MKKKILFTTLLITTFMVTCLVSGTYAKYISSIDLMDEARVAKWDINITNEVDLFKDSYYLDENDETTKYVESFSKLGDKYQKVVAPGTSGYYKFTISGKPETNYKINVTLDGEDTIGRLTYYLDNRIRCDTLEELMDEIEELYPSDFVHAAGTTPLAVPTENNPEGNSVHTISWVWNFEESDELNKEDTALGKESIIDSNDPLYNSQAHVKLSVKIEVVQSLEAATPLEGN